MGTQIFVNLPVKNLKKSIAFFSELGYAFNPHFQDEASACMIIGEHIFSMLLEHEKFSMFTPLPIVDANKSTEMLIALSCDSKEEVVAKINKAIKAGGTRYSEAKDHGFMYQDGFKDLDGHIWEIFWMDPKAIPG
ncbi:MAG: glyoxalase/bleomycin resistance/extradiol dioxygenase family protein [Oligoflexus sp.]|nr:glyoxalase/bleomycin resistance/extradiol dioxygenase family protein [Oligoflexus sp.]